MPSTLNPTCPLCGLRFGNQPHLDPHVREDHRVSPWETVVVPAAPRCPRLELTAHLTCTIRQPRHRGPRRKRRPGPVGLTGQNRPAQCDPRPVPRSSDRWMRVPRSARIRQAIGDRCGMEVRSWGLARSAGLSRS